METKENNPHPDTTMIFHDILGYIRSKEIQSSMFHYYEKEFVAEQNRQKTITRSLFVQGRWLFVLATAQSLLLLCSVLVLQARVDCIEKVLRQPPLALPVQPKTSESHNDSPAVVPAHVEIGLAVETARLHLPCLIGHNGKQDDRHSLCLCSLARQASHNSIVAWNHAGQWQETRVLQADQKNRICPFLEQDVVFGRLRPEVRVGFFYRT